ARVDHPAGGHHQQLRRARHPCGCAAREKRTPALRLPATARDRGQKLQSHQVRERRQGRPPAARSRRAQRSGCVSAARGARATQPRAPAAAGVPAPADTHVDALQERQVTSAIPKMNAIPAAADPDSAYVRIANLTKRFGDFVAVDDVSLDIRRGEIFCLLGGSGSGKTTLLRMLAGFELPSAGTIRIDGADMSAIPPYERPVNMMFQSYALFPHMSVEKNVAFGLEQEGLGREQVRRQVGEILDIVKMGGFGARKPHQLSGGQRQRVALARALVKRPKLLLVDEPLAALDKKLREHTQFELLNIQQRLGVTFIVVTHDQEEAMTLATRIGVMNRGEIAQIGT